ARDASRADELVEEDVGDRTDEGEVTPLLADQLMCERERNCWLERAPDRDGHAVARMPLDRLRERGPLVQLEQTSDEAEDDGLHDRREYRDHDRAARSRIERAAQRH